MNNFSPVSFVKHDDVGRILFSAEVPASMIGLQGDDTAVGDADHRLDYVVDGKIRRRPANTAVQTSKGLEALPIPCVVIVRGVSYPCNDGVVDLSFSEPGTYEVSVVAWPMLDATFEVVQK